MRNTRIARRWVEEGLVGVAGADRLGHPVVDFQNDALGSVFDVLGLVLLPDDRKGVKVRTGLKRRCAVLCSSDRARINILVFRQWLRRSRVARGSPYICDQSPAGADLSDLGALGDT
jgi:hypothetical protein